MRADAGRALTGDGIDAATLGRFRLSGGDAVSLPTAAFIAPNVNRESNKELLELFDLVERKLSGKANSSHHMPLEIAREWVEREVICGLTHAVHCTLRQSSSADRNTTELTGIRTSFAPHRCCRPDWPGNFARTEGRLSLAVAGCPGGRWAFRS